MPDFSSNLANADLSQYPSAASPLSIDELLKARAVSGAPPAAWTGGWPGADKELVATPQNGREVFTSAQPATPQVSSNQVPANTIPSNPGDARAAAMQGLGQLNTNLADATKAIESVPTDNPTVDALNQQIAGKSTPTQVRERPAGDTSETGTGKILPQFAPSMGQRILRGVRGAAIGLLTGGIPGAAVGAIEPQDIAGGTAYGAPNKLYERTEQARQADLGNLQGQRQSALDAWKQAVDARKAQASEFRANAALGKDVATGATDVMKADAGATKNTQTARQHGLKYDDQGNLVPVSYEEMTPAEQAQTDLRTSQSDLADARAALARAQSDPNSPAYRLALARIATAQRNADAAQLRANAYALNAYGANYGTDVAGNPLQGATELGGRTVGSRFQSSVQKQQSNVAQFNDVLGATRTLENTAKALVLKGGKSALSSPVIAAALAEPASTYGKWVQAKTATGQLSPEQRDYVTNLRAFRENLQALRKSAGGGVSDSQVDRLMEMAPGAATPDIDYLLRQTNQIRMTANRLSKGIPKVVGGEQIEGTTPAAPATAAPGSAAPAASTGNIQTVRPGTRID